MPILQLPLPNHLIRPTDISGIITKSFGVILLISAFGVGLFTYKDYGLAWDEIHQHEIGRVNFDYIFNDGSALLTHPNRDYGAAFELLLIFIERLLSLQDTREIFLARHLTTHTFFLISAFVFFLLIDFLYNNKILATVGFLFLVLCPRIYAHSFFNTKDLPFLSMYIICFYLTARAFDSKKITHFVFLGIATGALINLRIVGVLALGCTVLFLLLDTVLEKENRQTPNMYLFLVFITTSLATTYMTWPFLWSDPFGHFVGIFTTMTKFRWDSTVLFWGELVRSGNLNWSYSIVWFVITVPLVYLLTGIGGTGIFIRDCFRHPLRFLSNTKERNNLLYLLTFFTPIIAVIAFKSVLYDGWRHLYFIYPSFILLGIYGLNIFIRTKLRPIILTGIFLAFSSTAYGMVEYAPFQQVFFNRIANNHGEEWLRKNFELDYWGLSFRQALEYILAHDSNPVVKVAVHIAPGEFNKLILHKKDRKRLEYVQKEEATYFITNYRWHPEDYQDINQYKWHSIKVMNSSIVTIFKLR